MISRNPAIMQTVDGDKDTPESLFRKEKLQYLTVEEIVKFTKGKLTSAVQNARQADKPAGNRQPRTQARNNTGSQKRRVQQFSLLNSGQMGVEQSGQAERVETTGDLAFLVQLDQQDTIEKRTLTSESARQAKLRGMSDWEILEQAGVDTELKITL